MARITAEQAGGSNRIAFLDMLAFSESTSTSPVTQDEGYDIIVTGMSGPQRFSDYSKHPDVLVKVTNGLSSTAAGRYQLLYRYWKAYKDLLGLSDFGPVSQDKIALQQIKERNALMSIDKGDISHAVSACSNIWASLPGNTYGQHPHPIAILVRQYQKAGGTLHDPSASTS